MTDLEQAAQVDNEVVEVENENLEVDTGTETQTTESAPVDTVEAETQDAVQQRINKEVSRRHKETRRADELQREVDDLKSNAVTPISKEPTLEEFDFDEGKYKTALIKHEVAQAMAAGADESNKASLNQRAAEAQVSFNERVVALNKPDFDEKANAVPLLPPGVAEALVGAENGAELIYHLGEHLDVADKIANMSPQAALMELGRLSNNLSAQPTIKPSAAPDPIEPLNSGGSISTERGPNGATFT